MKGTLLLLVVTLAGCAASPPPPWVASDFDEHKVELTREGSYSDLNGIQLREEANRICRKFGREADIEVGAFREECVRRSGGTNCHQTGGLGASIRQA